MAVDDPSVLLFYHYSPIAEPEMEREWQRSTCEDLCLHGRVRVSPQGLNGTLSGSLGSLKAYAAAYTARMPSAEDVDWKISPAQADQMFSELRVRVVAEVVSLGVPFEGPSATAPHLSPVDFHQLLVQVRTTSESMAVAPVDLPAPSVGRVVLIDTRNAYEWQIGHFVVAGVETMLPPIRQFSELPRWIDQHVSALEGSTVLMYCTGGVRCESASAYLRGRGSRIGPVYQLRGGIERYLQAFPDGGFFRGRNHVFDKRLSQGPQEAEVIGRCLFCGTPTDSYAKQARCSPCRQLLLLCNSCIESNPADALRCSRCLPKSFSELGTSPKWPHLSLQQPSFVAGPEVSGLSSPPEAFLGASEAAPKLRVLCLHGFRQSATSMRGRCSQLQRKLSSLVSFVFVDAPHVLTPIEADVTPGELREVEHRARSMTDRNGTIERTDRNDLAGAMPCSPHNETTAEMSGAAGMAVASSREGDNCGSEHAMTNMDTLPVRFEEQGARAASGRRKLRRKPGGQLGAAKSTTGEHVRSLRRSERGAAQPNVASHQHSSPRFCWLKPQSSAIVACRGAAQPSAAVSSRCSDCSDALAVELESEGAEHSDLALLAGPARDSSEESDDGWEAAVRSLQTVFEEQGPFDGLLGLSQGSAVQW